MYSKTRTMSHLYFANRADPTMDYYRMTTKFDQRTGLIRSYYSRNGTPITAAIGETKRPCNVPTGPFYSVEPKPVKVCNCPVSCDHLAKQAAARPFGRPSFVSASNRVVNSNTGESFNRGFAEPTLDDVKGLKERLTAKENEHWLKARMSTHQDKATMRTKAGLDQGLGRFVDGRVGESGMFNYDVHGCSQAKCDDPNHQCGWDARFDEVCGRGDGRSGKWAAPTTKATSRLGQKSDWGNNPVANNVETYKKSLAAYNETPNGPPPAPFYCGGLTTEANCGVAGDYCAWDGKLCNLNHKNTNDLKELGDRFNTAQTKADFEAQAEDARKQTFFVKEQADRQAKAQANAQARRQSLCRGFTKEADCGVAGDFCVWSNNTCEAQAQDKNQVEYKGNRLDRAQEQAQARRMSQPYAIAQAQADAAAEAQAAAKAAAAAQAPAIITLAESDAELEEAKAKAAMAYYGNVARRRNSLSRMSRREPQGGPNYYGNRPGQPFF